VAFKLEDNVRDTQAALTIHAHILESLFTSQNNQALDFIPLIKPLYQNDLALSYLKQILS